MGLHLGVSLIDALKFGENDAQKLYLGNDLVWEPESTPTGVQVIETKRFWTGASVLSGPATLTLATTPEPGDVLFVHYVCIRQSSVRVISSISGCGATWANFWNGTSPSIWKGTAPTAAGNVVITQNSPAPMDAVLYLVRGLDPATGILATNGAGTIFRDQISVGELVLASHHAYNNGSNQMSYPDRNCRYAAPDHIGYGGRRNLRWQRRRNRLKGGTNDYRYTRRLRS
jgi:hypothetical protein